MIQRVKEFAESYNSRSPDMMKLYHPKAKLLPPGMPRLEGREGKK